MIFAYATIEQADASLVSRPVPTISFSITPLVVSDFFHVYRTAT